MKRLDQHNHIQLIPFQRPDLTALTGLTYADGEAAAWAVDAHGTRYRGAAAFLAVGVVCFGWPWLLGLYDVPLLRPLQDHIYEWVVRNRHHFPGIMSYCQRHPQHCRRS